LESYLENTRIGVRRLQIARTPEFLLALSNFVEETKNRPYQINPVQYIKSFIGSHDQDDLSSIFCSQLIAASYQKAGILSKEYLPNTYFPADFAADDIKGGFVGAKLSPILNFPIQKNNIHFDTTLDNIEVSRRTFAPSIASEAKLWKQATREDLTSSGGKPVLIGHRSSPKDSEFSDAIPIIEKEKKS